MIAELVRENFPALASWAIGCGGAFSLIQSIKLSRRECKAREMPHWLIRTLAFWFSGGITTITAYGLFAIPVETAVIHGFIIGCLYPVLMGVFMAVTSKYWPEVYDRLRVRRRRPGDNPDPNDETRENYF